MMIHLRDPASCRGSIRLGIFDPVLRFNRVTLARAADTQYLLWVEEGVYDPLMECTDGLSRLGEGVRLGVLCA